MSNKHRELFSLVHENKHLNEVTTLCKDWEYKVDLFNFPTFTVEKESDPERYFYYLNCKADITVEQATEEFQKLLQ